tara:strand:+ start:137 stop:820 length:684 start_codon:yes stop_codon:yes gene_type:complete
MIKLPKFSMQTMYDSETDFNLQMSVERMSKFLIHYEAFKLIKNIEGSIVECGIFKGTSFVRFGVLRDAYKKTKSKLIGFDVFNDIYPNTSFENEQKHRKHWIKTAGPSSISMGQLRKVFKNQKIKNYELVKGDVLKSIPKYLKKNKNLKISLLNIDLAFVEPTKCALELLYDKVVKNGVILFDNYGGEGTNGIFYKGETKVIKDFLKKKKRKIKKFEIFKRPAYIIK